MARLAWPRAALLVCGGALCLAPAAALAQQPIQGPPTALDGPNADIARPSGLGMSIARDGSGGLVYLKRLGGVAHVFVSQLTTGSFQAPVQVDSGLSGGSSQPVIAAGNGGVLLVGFINGGELYVVDRLGQTEPFAPPLGLSGGASSPAISMTNFGKAYIGFTAADGSGSDVRAAYFANGRWALEAPALNAIGADNAGTGSGRPAVTAAGDGVAIVVWGENGHVYSRRVWGTSPSVVYEQADAPPVGCTEASADEPVVAAGGDSSYAAVAFRELVTCGGTQQSRVLANRLHASIFDGINNADGLSGAPADGAADPEAVVTEYGQGWVTSERTTSNAVFAEALNQTDIPAGSSQVNSLPAAAPPDPVPAAAGLYSTLIAWQQTPGTSSPSEIRLRYQPAHSTLGPESVVSSPLQGPVDAGDGLTAAGDVLGEAAVAWLQGGPGATALMVEQMYQPPGAFSSLGTTPYVKTSEPSFSWTRPRGWGPLRYSLYMDGASAAETYGTSTTPAVPLRDGRHTWQVVATNPAGERSRTAERSRFVDTVAPRAKLRLHGAPVPGARLQARVSYRDLPPPGQPHADASGVVKVVVRWGDGTIVRLARGSHVAEHGYRAPGRYRITALVSDRAGNVTRLVTELKVTRTLPKGRRGGR